VSKICDNPLFLTDQPVWRTDRQMDRQTWIAMAKTCWKQ